MSTARNSNDSSWGRRKSFFALGALKSSTSSTTTTSSSSAAAAAPSPASDRGHGQQHDDDYGGSRTVRQTKTLTKKKLKDGDRKERARAPSLFTDLSHANVNHEGSKSGRLELDSLNSQRRPSLTMKTKRPPSVFESLRNTMTRGSSEDLTGNGHGYSGEPASTTSSQTPSLVFDQILDGDSGVATRMVLLHGEVQTSAGMFRKKKEYLVLTENYLLRFKSQAKAADVFRTIPTASGKSPVTTRQPSHSSMPSFGSSSDLKTLSDSSGDKNGRVPLRQVVATHKLEEGKPYFALEVCYLDEDSAQASVMTLQFGNPEERDGWLRRIRGAVSDALLKEPTSISPYNLENAARIVERDSDYDPANCAIYKVVQRQPAVKSGSRASSEDVTKVASTVCFLAIGVHKIHLVQLVKPVARTSSPSLASTHSQASHGILTLTTVKVSSVDDTFELGVRPPLQKARTLHLASNSSYEIAARIHFSENLLRPDCGHRLYRFSVPSEVEDLLAPPADPSAEEHNSLDRTLIAYCVAYGVNPANIRYTVNYSCEDAPRFELLSPGDSRRPNYGPLELLAIMRALRYNESFGSISFAGILLDSLNGLHDNYGTEHVCTRTKRGTPIRLTAEELSRSSLLVQEVRALAATSKKLRRMDFSGCITVKHAVATPTEEEPSQRRDIGSGIVEALFPLCKHQTTNVDWICLNGIELSETDQDYLVGAAVDKSCHFRAIELNRCGLNDRSMGLILDALRVQENTLESLELAGNAARINPSSFDSQLGMFGFIRKLNLSYISRNSGPEPFIQADTLLIWRLQELRLSGTALNPATIDAISTYLAHPQSSSLHELYLDNTYLAGADVATILHSLSWDPNNTRNMHLDISQCLLTKGVDKVIKAIASNLTPSHLSMRAIEYKEESMFRKVIRAVTNNRSLRFLDISQTALPGDASEDTCEAIERLLADNSTLQELDMSGDDSRLATSKFGPGINQALAGLTVNKSMQVFRIEKQKLGMRGASTLAEVVKGNRTLVELHCDNNEIPLAGLTDLVNALIENKTLIFLPTMNDGRAAAFRSAEATMKGMSDIEPPQSPTAPKVSPFSSASAMRKGFANVKKTTSRASQFTPSFPALPYTGRSSTSSDRRSSSSMTLHLPPSRKASRSPSSGHSPSGSTSGFSPFTIQDIQTTQRLLTEQWDRQCYRLEQYLHRNWCMLNHVPVNMEIEDEKFERPSSVGSIGKMLEQVKFDTTPKADLDKRMGYFDVASDSSATNAGAESETPRRIASSQGAPQLSPIEDKHGVSFKHFLLGSSPPQNHASGGSAVLSEDEMEFRAISGNMGAHRGPARLSTDIGEGDRRTPTQKSFGVGGLG